MTVRLEEEESELVFLEAAEEEELEELDCECVVVVFSVTDAASLREAELLLQVHLALFPLFHVLLPLFLLLVPLFLLLLTLFLVLLPLFHVLLPFFLVLLPLFLVLLPFFLVLLPLFPHTLLLLQRLWQCGDLLTKAVIVVGNKTDLVRTRDVPIDGEGREGED